MIWTTKRSDYFANDALAGMQSAMPERWKAFIGVKNAGALVRADFDPSHVAVIISGGGGNGPLFPGYVGAGLADAAVIGAPFAAPNAYTIYETGLHLGREKGVLLLYNNFSGDYLNNDMAAELLRMDGIEVESVISTDDIASAVGEDKSARSGTSGIAYLIKLASACAKRGMALRDMAAFLKETQTRLGTLSIHVDFAKNEMAYGEGFSGEPAIRVENHMDMQRSAVEMCDMLLEDLKPEPNEKIFIMVNRLRYTSYADGYIFAQHVVDYISKKYEIAQLRVANFSSIMDVYGFNVSLFCAGDEHCGLLKDNCYTDSFIF